MQALHLGLFGRENVLHFGLLIGCEVEMFGQFLGALSGILRAVVPSALALRGLGLRFVRWAILGRRERRGDRNGAGCNEHEQALLNHGNLLFKSDRSTSMNGIMTRKLRRTSEFVQSLHNFTKPAGLGISTNFYSFRAERRGMIHEMAPGTCANL